MDVGDAYSVPLAPLLAVYRERNHLFFFHSEDLEGLQPPLRITSPGWE